MLKSQNTNETDIDVNKCMKVRAVLCLHFHQRLIEDTCYTASLHAMCIVDQNVYDKSPLHAILNIQSEYILINCVYSIAIQNIQTFLQTCCRKLFAHWVSLFNQKITVHKYIYFFFTLCSMVFT